MTTTKDIISMAYIGKDDKYNSNTYYYLSFECLTCTIKVVIYTDSLKSSILNIEYYTDLISFLNNWVVVNDNIKLDEDVSIFFNKYKKQELIESISSIKTATEFYNVHFKDRSSLTRKVSNAFYIIRDLIIEKIQ